MSDSDSDAADSVISDAVSEQSTAAERDDDPQRVSKLYRFLNTQSKYIVNVIIQIVRHPGGDQHHVLRRADEAEGANRSESV